MAKKWGAPVVPEELPTPPPPEPPPAPRAQLRRTFQLAPGEKKRIDDALEALDKDPHSLTSLNVVVTLHVYREYPRLVRGRIVNSLEEEKAAK